MFFAGSIDPMGRLERLRGADLHFLSDLMDSKVTVFLIVVLLAALRGLMQRSQVRKEIQDRAARGLVSSKGRRLNRRTGPVIESEAAAILPEDDTKSTTADERE